MEEIKNPILEQKEKKDLRLKIKMPVDLKRWFSKKLDKIVSNFRQNNKELANTNKRELDITNMKANDVVNAITYQIKETLVRKADIYKVSKEYKIQDEYERRNENIEIMHSNKQISDKEYAKRITDNEYKKEKANYAHNIGETTERPKNPKVERAIQTAKKVGKVIAGIGVAGVGVAGIGGMMGMMGGAGVSSLTTSLPGVIQLIGATGIGAAAIGATGFGAVKLGKFIAQKAPLMLNEAKIVGKTAGKTIEEVGKSVAEKVSPILEESKKEVARDSAKKDIRRTKDLDLRSEKLEEKDKQFEGLYKEIIDEDYKAAIKENAKRGYSEISEEERQEIKRQQEERQEIEDVRSYENLDDRKEAFEVASDSSQQKIMDEDYLDALQEHSKRIEQEKIEKAINEEEKEKSLANKQKTFSTKTDNQKQTILNRDYERAIKEDSARKRRESLHMEKEQVPINHEAAIERVEGDGVSPEEVKEQYGDEGK